METQVKVLMKWYRLGKFLGQGSFAKVYHAKRLEMGENVAIKTIDKARIVKAAMEPNVEREVMTMMRTARHPNIVWLQEVMALKKRIYLVLEYVRGGELFSKLKQGKFGKDDARKYFRQLIAVDFCHSRSVYHRDLKPENLLLDDDENLKKADFGLGALNESKRQDGFLHMTCGTPA